MPKLTASREVTCEPDNVFSDRDEGGHGFSQPALDEPETAVISTTAMRSLDRIAPHVSAPSDENGSGRLQDGLGSRSRSMRRVLMTAVPLAIADLTALTLCFVFATVVMLTVTGWIVATTFVYQFVAAASLYLAASLFLGLYPGSGMSPPFELRQVVSAVSLTFFALLVLDSVFGTLSRGEAAALVSGAVASTVVVPVSRFVTRLQLAKYAWWGERVVIVGATTQGLAIYRFLHRNPQRGLRPVGLVDEPHEYWREVESETGVHPNALAMKYLGTVDELPQIARRHSATWAIAAIASRSPEEISRVLTRCSMMPDLLFLPSRAAIPSLWIRAKECGGIAGVHIEDRLLRLWPRFLKRTGDLLAASIGLALLSPVLVGIGLAVYLRSPGPIFYGHTRIGRGGRSFRAWKFRTMVVNADEVLQEHLEKDPALQAEWERDQKLKDDPRIIPGIGQFLRRTSLDELPQLWNVVIGQMSLVGPRPIVKSEIDKYEEFYPLYLRVRPGLTGVWQISGRNNTTYASRVTFDTYYVRNWSLWLDIYVMLRTVRTIALREGAY